jgi:hypothetical protein
MSPPAICCGTTPSLAAPAGESADAHLQALQVVDRLLISLRNQPPIWRRCCRPGNADDVELLVELVHQVVPPPWYIQAFCMRCIEAERHRGAEGEGRVLADIVVGRGVAHLDRAVGDRVERLQAGHDFAAANTWIWNLLSVASATALRRLRRRRRSCRATSGSSTSGAI